MTKSFQELVKEYYATNKEYHKGNCLNKYLQVELTRLEDAMLNELLQRRYTLHGVDVIDLIKSRADKFMKIKRLVEE